MYVILGEERFYKRLLFVQRLSSIQNETYYNTVHGSRCSIQWQIQGAMAPQTHEKFFPTTLLRDLRQS